MPDAPEDWKIACLKTIQDMPSGAGFEKGITPKQDLIWIQDLWRDGYISANFRRGYLEDGEKFADSTIPNLIWDVHILDKGRQFIKECEHKEIVLSAQIATNKPSNSKEKEQAQSQPPSVDGDNGFKTEPFFDNIFKLLAGIAFVSWMIQEYVLPHNKLFLFLKFSPHL